MVADLFGDEDMRDVASMSVKTGGDLATGLEETALLDSLTRLARERECEGLVCGSGFEDRPSILARLARHWPLIGNDAATVARAKDPFALAALYRKLGIPHPKLRATRPADARNWLRKRVGGSGGTHVQPADQIPPTHDAEGRLNASSVSVRAEVETKHGADLISSLPAAGFGQSYYQRRVPGRAVSTLFLANGEKALVVGFSAQWPSPTRDSPARYGGAVRPAGISQGLRKELGRHVGALSRVLGLRGLNSVDFLVGDDEEFWLIEINPRPGATLDLFDCPTTPLFALHADACHGVLPTRLPRWRGAAAAAIVYATRSIPRMPALNWPKWCADRQVAGSNLSSGEPICTIRAHGCSSARAKALAESRRLAILAMAQGERE